MPAEATWPESDTCNRLALEPGRFARQHALDPIDWQPWSARAFAEARDQDKPLMVLSGFSADRESRSLELLDPGASALVRDINRRFVPVLVDRLERPDVDAYLMQACEVLTGGAGWPAIVFLDADGRPFEAFSRGAASRSEKTLAAVVAGVIRHLALGGGNVAERAEATAEKMQKRLALDRTGPRPGAARLAEALRAEQLAGFDSSSGTFGPPPLFARPPLLGFLLAWPAAPGDSSATEAVTILLEKLAAGEMADRKAGGFHRYARSTRWRDPAAEKMLADNAALATVYLDAAAATGREDFREAARATLAFLLRDLRLPAGDFAASVDGEDSQACENCPTAAADSSATAQALSAGRDPAQDFERDGLVMADANALAISALARASSVLGDAAWLAAASRAAEAVDAALREGGVVKHCAWPDGRRCTGGYLADSALLALAFLDLDAATAGGDSRWMAAARAVADDLPLRFEHQGTGGFFLDDGSDESLPLRLKPELDGAFPCGNSAAALLYTRLAARTGEKRYADLAGSTFEAFATTLTLRGSNVPSMVTALAQWERLSPELRAERAGP